MKHVSLRDMCSTYQHIYLPVPPEKPQRVEESTVWYGSLESPFLPAIQHKMPTIHVQNEQCCFFSTHANVQQYWKLLIFTKYYQYLLYRIAETTFLTSLSGSPNRNSLSKRPGLLRAGSMESSLFVAPITTTSPLLSNPSIRARRVDTMELQTQRVRFRFH